MEAEYRYLVSWLEIVNLSFGYIWYGVSMREHPFGVGGCQHRADERAGDVWSGTTASMMDSMQVHQSASR